MNEIRFVALAFSLLILAALVGIFVVGREELLVLLLGPPDREKIDFSDLHRPDTPNTYLVCPEGFCSSPPDEISPSYEVNVLDLKGMWLEVVQDEPRVTLLGTDDELQMDFEQRTFLFRFPDTITVRFIPLAERLSTLAVYSRSHYGYSDLGTNRKRVLSWLRRLMGKIRPIEGR